MRNVMNKDLSDTLLEAARRLQDAQIFNASTQLPSNFQVVPLNLATALLEVNAFKVSIPFKSVYFMKSEWEDAEIFLKPMTNDQNQGALRLNPKDTLNFENAINGCFLYWTSNAPSANQVLNLTKAYLLFAVDAVLRPATIARVFGNVFTDNYATFSTAKITLAATTPTALTYAGTVVGRQSSVIQNNTGADLYLGTSIVTNAAANFGYKLAAGDSYIWKNSSILYGYSVAGGDVNVMTETNLV